MAAVVVAAVAATSACAGEGDPEIVVRTADQIQVVDPETAAALLADGQQRVADGEAVRPGVDDGPAVTESNRSFQVRLGTALTLFNTCLSESGFTFVGIPGQSDDPRAADSDYLAALISCNNETGIGNILAEQSERQSDLTADQKRSINESGRSVFDCIIDRGWDLGELEPNDQGILNPTRFPALSPERQPEFERDLDDCGWNDLDLG